MQVMSPSLQPSACTSCSKMPAAHLYIKESWGWRSKYLVAIWLSEPGKADSQQGFASAGQVAQALVKGCSGLADATELWLFRSVYKVAHNSKQRAAWANGFRESGAQSLTVSATSGHFSDAENMVKVCPVYSSSPCLTTAVKAKLCPFRWRRHTLLPQSTRRYLEAFWRVLGGACCLRWLSAAKRRCCSRASLAPTWLMCHSRYCAMAGSGRPPENCMTPQISATSRHSGPD